jgi:Ca-activated chloride channel homolog
MRFGSPHLLWLLCLIPMLALFLFWASRRKAQLLRRFAQVEMLKRLTEGISRPMQALKLALLLLAFAFLALAISRPQFGTKMELMRRKGLDIAVAMDVSQSMFAEDIKPNRLVKSKAELSKFLDKLTGDRVALIAFAGEAYMQCPLTADYGAIRMFLDVLDPSLIETPGTHIEAAIEMGMKAFDPKERKYRVLVLLTDGEDHSGRALAMAEEAARQGIKIYTVGIGSPSGVPIPIRDERGNVTYKKDNQGNVVTSRLDESLLQKISLATGGQYYAARPGQFELQKVVEAIHNMEKREMESQLFNQFEERYQIPLGITLGLLIAELLLSDRRKRRREWTGRFS